MKRKVVGLVMLSLVATAWGRGKFIDKQEFADRENAQHAIERENMKRKSAMIRERLELRQYEREPEDPILLAIYYLSCSQSVDRVERELENYRLNEDSVKKLSATEIKYYNEELTNRMQVVAMKRQELNQVKGKMTRASWKETSRILKERQRETEEAEARIKIQMLKADELKPKAYERNRPLRTGRQGRERTQNTSTRIFTRILTPEEEAELDSIREALSEFQKLAQSRGNRYLRPFEIRTLEKQGFSSEISNLAMDYFNCTQEVASVENDLRSYMLDATTLSALTADELAFYQLQVSNRVERVEKLQSALAKINGKMTTNMLAAVSAVCVINVRREQKAAESQKRQEIEKKIKSLQEMKTTQKRLQILTEDMSGLNVSNLVIRQVCCTPHSTFSGLRVFSYTLTITDGHITKIEELPEEKLGEIPIIPIIIEKNK